MAGREKSGATIGHVGIEVSNLRKSRRFYDALLKGLGLDVVMETEDTVGYSGPHFQVWLGKSAQRRVMHNPPTGEEFVVTDHIAILVDSKEAVDSAAAEMEGGGFAPLFPPEEHPEFSPGYYAVSFCDPDCYVVEVYTRGRTESET